jgi:hypothetical protein
MTFGMLAVAYNICIEAHPIFVKDKLHIIGYCYSIMKLIKLFRTDVYTENQ